jgi:hypothetical protein
MRMHQGVIVHQGVIQHCTATRQAPLNSAPCSSEDQPRIFVCTLVEHAALVGDRLSSPLVDGMTVIWRCDYAQISSNQDLRTSADACAAAERVSGALERVRDGKG